MSPAAGAYAKTDILSKASATALFLRRRLNKNSGFRGVADSTTAAQLAIA
jgi:hypothetical protein